MTDGKFIVFEGLDGSGLSTQSSLLKKYLTEKGYETLLTKEQTNSVLGGLIKSALKKEFNISPLTLQILFAADRAHHLSKEIEPALKEGKIVISDRYFLSSLAFGSLDVDQEFLKQINSKFRIPDLTFIIDCMHDVCLNRMSKDRFNLELFEEKPKMEKIRQNYLSLKDYHPNIYLIDGCRNVEEVFVDVKRIVDKHL